MVTSTIHCRLLLARTRLLASVRASPMVSAKGRLQKGSSRAILLQWSSSPPRSIFCASVSGRARGLMRSRLRWRVEARAGSTNLLSESRERRAGESAHRLDRTTEWPARHTQGRGLTQLPLLIVVDLLGTTLVVPVAPCTEPLVSSATCTRRQDSDRSDHLQHAR